MVRTRPPKATRSGRNYITPSPELPPTSDSNVAAAISGAAGDDELPADLVGGLAILVGVVASTRSTDGRDKNVEAAERPPSGMDADDFVDAVESATATELDRLGSSKLLVALTDADLDAGAVLRVAATSERTARETLRAWADTESNETARAAFVEVAEREDAHYERVTAELDSFEPPEEVDEVHAYLRALDGTVERVAAGLVGRGLVSTRTHAQLVGFFVNEADRDRADLFRELKDDTEASVDRGVDVLDVICETDDHWARARDAAESTIETAYAEYADSLDDLGIDPKPVC